MKCPMDRFPAGPAAAALADAAMLLWQIPAHRRPGVLVRALACVPEISLKASLSAGPIRAKLSSAWEWATGTVLPIDFLRHHLATVADAATMSAVRNFAVAKSLQHLEDELAELIGMLAQMQVVKCQDRRAR
jgi:hypothetical protein